MSTKTNNEDEAVALKSSANERNIANPTGKIHPGSLAALGDAFGVALLLGNHAKFGLAERCCYHFDLIETLTSLPDERSQYIRSRARERGESISSYDGGFSNLLSASLTDTSENYPSKPNDQSAVSPSSTKSCYCGVISLLECVPSSAGDSRISKRALRSKHREFNIRAQKSWGRTHRGSGVGPKKHNRSAGNISEGHGSSGGLHHCHQPRHLPLPLNPSTRVTFAYELTSVAIVIDASPSITAATFLTDNCDLNEGCCVPLDRLGVMLRSYLKGLIHPIDVPPVSLSGLGIAFGKWTPHLAVTVVASYPPTQRRDNASARLLVRDFRIVDEESAMELVRQVERWALNDVEGVIADRLSGEKRHFGDGLGGRSSQYCSSSTQNNLATSPKLSSWTSIKSSMKDILAVGDAALATLPPEGRPTMLIASDCMNVHCGVVFDYLAETSRSDVPVSVINLSNGFCTFNSSSIPLDVSDDSTSLRDACHQSGGIFLDGSLLDSYINTIAGSSACLVPSFHGDAHFISKKRSIRPNALQWCTLFSFSPLTPAHMVNSMARSINSHNKHHQTHDSLSSFGGAMYYTPQQSFETPRPTHNLASTSNPDVLISTQTVALNERTFFVKYNINPVRIKSLLMSRILEGYKARRYGHNTQDPDKVSIHMTLKLSDCGIMLHYELSFVSSPHHVPTVGTAHIKLELSGDDVDFVSLVKRKFIQHGQESTSHQSRIVSAINTKAAEKICKLLRWVRKEDYLDSYLCLPGWGDTDYFMKDHSFLRRLETLTMLQMHRHFRCEVIEIVTIKGSKYENQNRAYALFSDLMESDEGEDNLYEAISSWADSTIEEKATYVKVLPLSKNDLTYYAIIQINRHNEASRLFTITMNFHGELDAEERLDVVASFRDRVNSCENLVILEKKISHIIAVRPELQSIRWIPKLTEYFLHHRSWDIVKDPEVIPLITKRRSQIGNFMIIHSEENRALFAKFVNNDAVIYQVLARSNGIFVDIHMESNRSLFNPFYAKDSAFRAIYEKVKMKDMECAKNLHARSNLLQVLDHSAGYKLSQAGDVLRLIKNSSRTERRLRFFKGISSANDVLFRLTSDFITSGSLRSPTAKLVVDQTAVGSFTGAWFLMRVDWYVLSAILLSTNRIEEKNSSFTQLIFFTAGITTLYPSDNSNNDTKDENIVTDDDDIYGLSLLLNELDESHGKNYAKALYEVLRLTYPSTINISADDVTYALSFCSFRAVLQEFISLDDLSDQLSDDVETMTGIKLYELILTLLCPIPGSNGEVFYFIGDDGIYRNISGDKSIESLLSNDMDQSIITRQSNDEEIDQQFDHKEASTLAPLFFRLYLDGHVASREHISSIKKSTTLEVRISTFNNDNNLSQMHLGVISKLKQALNSFAVEQQLEKFRYFGDSLCEDDIQIITKILPQTKHESFDVPLSFFVAKTKSIEPASNPSGSTENDLDHGYSSLLNQLDEVCARRSSNNTFLLSEDSNSLQVIPYWCILHVVRSLGVVVITAYHPLGEESAQHVIERARTAVNNACRKTNQLLLLEEMYKTRSACGLLIKEDQVLGTGETSMESEFSCPIQYKKTMELHARCTSRQAIDALTSSTLQNFLLSNRRRMFVYKDEDGNIFYMTLSEKSQTIELSVHGLCEPGPSITEQLVCLIQKNMLMLPLNTISSVLMKNPYYALLPSDVAFLRGFNDEMVQLDSEYDNSSAKSKRSYALPSHIRNPLFILLLFRRNITGSTFIHHFHEWHENDATSMATDVLGVSDSGEMILRIPPSEFTFFFNSSPSQLDPNYQTVSTLTERGRQLSREAGSGIAIIEISLHADNKSKNVVSVIEETDQDGFGLNVSKSDTILKRLEEDDNTTTPFKIMVEITNTTVDIEVLHKWVELSLNQVIVAWNIETAIRHSKTVGYTPREKDNVIHIPSRANGPPNRHQYLLQKVLPDAQVLEDLMRISIQLPHPASGEVYKQKMIQSHALANLTLQQTQMIMGILCAKAKISLLTSVHVIRCTEKASVVSIRRDSKSNYTVCTDLQTGKKIQDKAMENPEYIVLFGLGQFDQFSIMNASQLFFKEISETRPAQHIGFTQALSSVKKKHPELFIRHMAFVLRITRRSRTLKTYNMHPQILMNIKSRFSEIDEEISRKDEMYRNNLHSKCLLRSCDKAPGVPHPIAKATPISKPANNVDVVKQERNSPQKEDSSPLRGPKRRIPRPTSMLKPTLIGKSVEGSAMQAVAASRLRASSRPLPQHRSVSGSGKSPNTTVIQKEKEKSRAKKSSLSIKDVGKSSNSHPLAVSSSIKRIHDMLAFLKPVTPIAGSSRLNQASIQSMIQLFLRNARKENDNRFTATQLMTCCCGNYLGSWSVEHLSCDNSEVLVQPFLHQVLDSFGSRRIISLEKPTSKLSDACNAPVFVGKALVSSAVYQATIVLKLFMTWDKIRKSNAFTCSAWLIISTDIIETNKGTKGYARQSIVDRESNIIETYVEEFLNDLTLESEVLNFAGKRLADVAKRTHVHNKQFSTSSLLRAAIVRFQQPPRHEKMKYHLQMRYLCPTTFLRDILLDNYQKTTLCTFLKSNCQEFHLLDCDAFQHDPCFAGSLKIVGFVVHFFITWHETVESAFEIFVLTETNGQRVDLYIGKKRSQYAEQLSHVILYSTMCTVQDILQNAVLGCRKKYLWGLFGKKYRNFSIEDENGLLEMVKTSNRIEIETIDKRVELLFDESNDLQISWQELFLKIHLSYPFTHCITVSSNDRTHYLVYVKSTDIFLHIQIQNHAIKDASVLHQGIKSECDAEIARVVDQLINYIAKWMFLTSCQFNLK